jgi:cold shock CspA family protein/ribosome-associated translation inhibitor RaiA
MDIPLEIAFKNIDKSDFLDGLIRGRVDRLENYHDHIVSCRVVVETPFRAPEGGKPALGIAVEVMVPGSKMLVAKEQQHRHDAKADHAAVVNRAFERIERQLEDHKDIRHGDVKAHEAAGQTGRVARLFPDQNYGFIEIAGSHDLYFTRNAVLGADYDDLEVGSMVRVTVATTEGPMGPQASSVRPLGDMTELI